MLMVTLCHCDPTALTIEGRGKPEEEDVAILLALISSDMAAVRVNGVLGGPFSLSIALESAWTSRCVGRSYASRDWRFRWPLMAQIFLSFKVFLLLQGRVEQLVCSSESRRLDVDISFETIQLTLYSATGSEVA